MEERAPENVPVITFDGPSGSGKGTLSRGLAARLGWHWLDSGALYRIVGMTARQQGLAAEHAADVRRAAALACALQVTFELDADGAGECVRADGADVTAAIRADAVATSASQFAAQPPVREALLALQRGFRRPPGLVADGRDMGTVVFTDARLKIYATASARERARRRCAQLSQAGADASIDRIYRDIAARDQRDQARRHSPLKPASDAVVLDTTDLEVGETLDRVLAWAEQRGLA